MLHCTPLAKHSGTFLLQLSWKERWRTRWPLPLHWKWDALPCVATCIMEGDKEGSWDLVPRAFGTAENTWMSVSFLWVLIWMWISMTRMLWSFEAFGLAPEVSQWFPWGSTWESLMYYCTRRHDVLKYCIFRLSYSRFCSFSSRSGAKSRILSRFLFIWRKSTSRLFSPSGSHGWATRLLELSDGRFLSVILAVSRWPRIRWLKHFQNESPNICSHHTPASSHAVIRPAHRNRQPQWIFIFILHPQQRSALIALCTTKVGKEKKRK